MLAFVNWVREVHTLMRLEQVDARADELVTQYLQLHIEEGKSAYTLQTERSALRLFFRERTLAQAVTLPRNRSPGRWATTARMSSSSITSADRLSPNRVSLSQGWECYEGIAPLPVLETG